MTSGPSAQPAPTWPALLNALVSGTDVSGPDLAWAMDQIMSGDVSPVRIAGLLVALRAKGESVVELTALADTMLAHAVRFEVPGPSIDLVGTGGDRMHTVNVSTMAALVVAGTGTTVVKHGNRAASSSSGSADMLEALGIRLDHTVDRVAALATEVGITFCFAQVFHPSMRHVGAARGELGIPTVFNFLGPLTNPAQPRATAVGVADLRMAPLMAGVFASRGTSALVFRGADGLDELAATGPAQVWEVRDAHVVQHTIDAAHDLGLTPITPADLRGADARHNADVARRLLAGEPGPVRETVLLNAAAALVADGRLPGTADGDLVERLRVAMEHAARAVDEGSAAAVLERWVAASAA
ncbi:anthranilate phosphoribosyltransferase [Cellulomonas sp. P24]|uniref:anthranilate phosphoribosyltransferase n=1 Tax=Cellulomonas sp. P24 TaxID=2885206 RepID=UPI00216B3222|nr:anthranilate phosphoribosyltransferase [Cellulomonas sp. P24]MCR6494214.1 anthranilate phosphoribosyltransferase [Cellulomonas sp. P24]